MGLRQRATDLPQQHRTSDMNGHRHPDGDGVASEGARRRLGRPVGLLGRLCLAGFGVVAAGLMCELAARVFLSLPLYAFERGMFVKDEAAGYRLQRSWTGRHSQPEYSYVIRTNSWGWRGPEPRLEAARRVLVLGDSIAFGQGVEDGKHICDLAREHLVEQRGGDLLNASAPGYCLVNEVPVLEELLPRYRPSLVIQIFCPNDFGARESLMVKDGRLLLDDPKRVAIAVRSWLNQHCHLYCLVKKVCYAHCAPKQDSSFDAPRSYEQNDLDFVVEKLVGMDRLCREADARFVVFISPGPGEIGRPQGWFESLLEALQERSIPCRNPGVSITPQQLREFVFPHDGHWNQIGCEELSHVLVDVIERQLGAIRRCQTGTNRFEAQAEPSGSRTGSRKTQ